MILGPSGTPLTSTPELPARLLDTRRGHRISNHGGPPWTPRERRDLETYRQRHFTATFRPGADYAYNCHGMVFAARRATIDDVSEVQRIIEHDDYVPVLESEVLPGDVVIYRADPSGEIEHSGIVVQLVGSPGKFRVWSKWGRGPEVLHALYDCPYEKTNIQYLRPREQP